MQLGQPASRTRRLLCLFAFCGGLLLLLSSRPADAAEPWADASAAADASPAASADATASLSRPRARRLPDLDAVTGLAGVGLPGSNPFTLVDDPATDNLLPTGELTVADLTGEVPAGSGVLEWGPIASGTQGTPGSGSTGAASDLLAVLGAGLVTAGFLAVRAGRPDTAAKGGGDR